MTTFIADYMTKITRNDNATTMLQQEHVIYACIAKENEKDALKILSTFHLSICF
jgi:hypothetical protein